MTTEPTTKFPSLPPDELGLPDLQEWIAFYGGYDLIPNGAWTEWDRLHEAYRERQRLAGGNKG